MSGRRARGRARTEARVFFAASCVFSGLGCWSALRSAAGGAGVAGSGAVVAPALLVIVVVSVVVAASGLAVAGTRRRRERRECREVLGPPVGRRVGVSALPRSAVSPCPDPLRVPGRQVPMPALRPGSGRERRGAA